MGRCWVAACRRTLATSPLEISSVTRTADRSGYLATSASICARYGSRRPSCGSVVGAGGESMANALRTVRWWQCRRRAIAACDNRSTSCSRRISAQSETFMVTSVDPLGGMARPTCAAARQTGPDRRGDSRRPRAATRALAPGVPDTPPSPWPPVRPAPDHGRLAHPQTNGNRGVAVER